MESPLPVYTNILSQPAALEQVLRFQLTEQQDRLAEAARLLRQAERVVVSAIGASYAAATAFVYRLAGAGISAVLEEASELLHYKLPAYGRGTVFLFISRSGESVEIVKLLEALQGRGQTMIGMTNEPDSRLDWEADVALQLGSPADDLIAVQTYSATVFSLHLLAEEVLQVNDADERKRQAIQAIQAVRQTLDHFRQAGAFSGLAKDSRVYLLARGASMASAREGALLFHEMARYPANTFFAGSFRHGPWEIVEPGFEGLVFAPDDATYPLQIDLAQTLAGLGGQVHLITAHSQENLPAGVQLWQIPDVSPFLSPLVEIVPVQLAVYDFACRQSHTPGEFRASSLVTASETGRPDLP